MRLQDWITKMSLNPTALKFTAPTVQVCTKASMPAMRTAFALDLAGTITVITGFGLSWGMMMLSVDRLK
jgi:hypothetical protein